MGAWALISQTDHSATGVTVAADGLSASMSDGHCRLDAAASSGKRQLDMVNGGGTARIVAALCNGSALIDDAINDANHWVYDGTGYFGHAGWDAGGHVGLGAGDVLSLLWDADAGNLTFLKNGLFIAGNAMWSAGSVLGTMKVLFGSSTNIAAAGLTIKSDPATFVYPQSGYTGFLGLVSANFLPLF